MDAVHDVLLVFWHGYGREGVFASFALPKKGGALVDGCDCILHSFFTREDTVGWIPLALGEKNKTKQKVCSG